MIPITVSAFIAACIALFGVWKNEKAIWVKILISILTVASMGIGIYSAHEDDKAKTRALARAIHDSSLLQTSYDTLNASFILAKLNGTAVGNITLATKAINDSLKYAQAKLAMINSRQNESLVALSDASNDRTFPVPASLEINVELDLKLTPKLTDYLKRTKTFKSTEFPLTDEIIDSLMTTMNKKRGYDEKDSFLDLRHENKQVAYQGTILYGIATAASPYVANGRVFGNKNLLHLFLPLSFKLLPLMGSATNLKDFEVCDMKIYSTLLGSLSEDNPLPVYFTFVNLLLGSPEKIIMPKDINNNFQLGHVVIFQETIGTYNKYISNTYEIK